MAVWKKEIIHKFLVVVCIFVILLIVSVFEEGFTAYNVFFLMNQGGRVDYNIKNVRTFVQCYDSDPANLGDMKGICHAQYYDGNNEELKGMDAVDYCKSEKEVIDYYCSADFSCEETILTYEKGFVCKDGKFIKKKNELLKLFDFNELSNSFGRMFNN